MTAWLVAAAVFVALLVFVWWAVGRGRWGRGAELALRRYDLRRPAAPDGVDGARRGQHRRGR